MVRINIGGSETDCDSTGLDVSYSKLICRTRPDMKNNFKNSPKILKPSKTYFTVIGGEELIIEGQNLLPTDDSCDTSGLLYQRSNLFN